MKQQVITDTTKDLNPVIAQEDKYAFIEQLAELRKQIPRDLIIDPKKWAYICRNVLKGQNMMLTGPSGSGKTSTTRAVANTLKRPYYYFNLGATQDPRSALIGDVHYSEDKGTYLNESEFIKAITTEYAVILLDEMSRAHPDAWNILMTVTDPIQRYVRLDESDDKNVIKVAKGVAFVGTANIGNEYTATRVLDRAIKERFHLLEMDLLTTSQEEILLKRVYPNISDDHIKAVAEIAGQTRDLVKRDDNVLETEISTRLTLRIADMLSDGFSLKDSVSLVVNPFFNNEGGEQSERARLMTIIEKYIDDDSSDDLFREDDIDNYTNDEDDMLS